MKNALALAGAVPNELDCIVPWPVGTTNSNYIAGQEAPAEALPKFSLSPVRDIKIQVEGTSTHCHH